MWTPTAATFTKDEEADEETKKKTEESEKALKALFEEATGNKELEVKLQTLTDADTSALLVQDEQGRRFSDMSKMYGQDFKMPEKHTLVLNRADSVVQRLLGEEDADTKALVAAQLYDLARMSVRPLEKGRDHRFPRPLQQAAKAGEIGNVEGYAPSNSAVKDFILNNPLHTGRANARPVLMRL